MLQFEFELSFPQWMTYTSGQKSKDEDDESEFDAHFPNNQTS